MIMNLIYLFMNSLVISSDLRQGVTSHPSHPPRSAIDLELFWLNRFEENTMIGIGLHAYLTYNQRLTC